MTLYDLEESFLYIENKEGRTIVQVLECLHSNMHVDDVCSMNDIIQFVAARSLNIQIPKGSTLNPIHVYES